MIYFIQDSATLNIKIGYTSTSAGERMRQLQTGNPSQLVLLGVIEGEQTDERNLHVRFADFRVAGEWFKPHPDLLVLVAGGIREATPGPKIPGYLGSAFDTAANGIDRPVVKCPWCGCYNDHRTASVGMTGALAWVEIRCSQNCLFRIAFRENRGDMFFEVIKLLSDPPSDFDLDGLDDPPELSFSKGWLTFWPRLREKVGGILGVQLARHTGTPVVAYGGIHFTFPVMYERERLACDRPESAVRIKQAIKDVIGQDWHVHFLSEAAS